MVERQSRPGVEPFLRRSRPGKLWSWVCVGLIWLSELELWW
uniref:Uncharacterized protein n=1 Tax=Fagus sylvatica TaxID=28930 RepID=A0A2N9F649_FAGSY